tara:strand:+ start:1453 stop:3525 length:2073 start_codon:yes stop_codon:yes gene_type:complete
MRVPQYKSGTQQTAEVGGQRFTVQASPAASSAALGALGSLAETATNIAFDFYEKEKKIQDESQITDLSNEYRLGVQDLFEQSKLQDPEVQDSWFNENEKKLRGQIIGRSGNRRVRNALTNDTDNVYTSIFPTVRKFANTRRIDKRLAGAFEKAQLLIRDSADPESKALRNRAYTELLGNPELGITGLYDQLQEENLISATDALELITKAKNEISRNRIFAEFNQLRTISQKNAYIKNLQNYIPEGLDNEDVRSIANSLGVEVRRQQSQYAAAVKGVRDEIKGDIDIIERGGIVPPERIDLHRRRAGATNDPVTIATLQQFEVLNETVDQTRGMSPPEIRDFASSVQSGGLPNYGGKGADTDFELDLRDVLNKRASYLETEINRNPLNAAENTGLVDVPPLDFSNPEAAATSVRKRFNNDDIVSNTYGLKPGSAFFKAGEVAALSTALRDAPASGQLLILSNIVNGAGKKSPVIIEKIAEESPELAHAAAMIQLDLPDTARRVVQGGINRKAQEIGGTQRDFSNAAQEIIGPALAMQPNAYAQVIEGAKSIYADRTFGTPKYNEFDQEEFDKALEAAAGGANGYGGVQEIFGAKTIIPPYANESMVEEAIENLDDRSIELVNFLRTGESTKVDVDQGLLEEIRDGEFKLMSMGGEYYSLYKGDYESNPDSVRFAQDRLGNKIIVDLRAMLR